MSILHVHRPGRPFALAALLFFASMATGHASGGFSCRADDSALRLSAGSAVTRGLGGGMLDFNGRLDLRAASIARDLRSTRLARQHLVQSWFRNGELRLSIYFERDEPHATVDLVVTTRAVDEGSYRGEYALTVHDTTGQGQRLERRGQVTCSVE